MHPQDHHRKTQRQAQHVVEQMAMRPFRAKVASIYPDGRINLQRESNIGSDGVPQPDNVPTPRLNAAQSLEVGEYVWAAQYGGQSFVLGPVKLTGYKTFKDYLPLSGGQMQEHITLPASTPIGEQAAKAAQVAAANDNANTRWKRNATEDIIPAVGAHPRVNKGVNPEKIMLEFYKDQGAGVLETALRFHQAGRYQYRIAADNRGIHIKDGDPTKDIYRFLYVEDLVTDNNVGVKNNRVRADNAQIRADDAWNLANSKVGQHHHIYTRTNWTNLMGTDGNNYMINGIWQDAPTSGIVL